jgi:hypothetical protein
MIAIRKEWLEKMLQIVSPVLDALETGTLHECLPSDFHHERSEFAPLEAFGRSILGIAPWLELDSSELDEEERALQELYREKVRNCLAQCSNPDSKDFMQFKEGGQPLVDAAFLAHALVRAPKQLAELLPEEAKRNLANALRSSRAIPAHNCNWIFFSAMVEAGLYVLGEDYDLMRILYPIRQFQDWYMGDGVYGDGPDFHWDYYNSFVIQPMYVDLVNLFEDKHPEIAATKQNVLNRASRYASVLERMISPEGSYPIIGRSICYRFGAFQLLSQCALQHRLEEHLTPAGVRSALTAVLRRTMDETSVFDEEGWLLPGIIGEQSELAEEYINIGSLYLCSAVFLPLGLSPKDDFWTKADEPWTAKKIWSGGHSVIDHAL